MTQEDKEIIKELIDIIETDLLNNNGSSVLTRFGKLKEKPESKKISVEKNLYLNNNMTKEEKDLLLRDLCARLLYKPRVRYYYCSIGSAAINGYSDEGYLSYQNLEDFSIYPKYGLEKTRVYNILPYLRPMSSMTEEERNEYLSIKMQECERVALAETYRPEALLVILDWLNAHHFDYRGLIERKLAIDCTNLHIYD